MKKINETYQHEGTGISFQVDFKMEFSNLNEPNEVTKTVNIMASPNEYRGSNGFVFKHSRPDTIQKIGRALMEIGEFVEKL